MRFTNLIIILAAGLFFGGSVAAQTDAAARDKAIELFRKADYQNSVKMLKQFTKQNSQDYLAFYYLGLSLERQNKLKDAEKAIETSVKLKADFAQSQTALAYILLRRNKLAESARAAGRSAALDAKDETAFYVLGMASLRLGKPEAALENVEKTISLNPKFGGAYLLKAHAIMNRNLETKDYRATAARYGTAADSIGKYIVLTSGSPDAAFWRDQQESLNFFARYYTEKEKNKTPTGQKDPNATDVKILKKRRANYTDGARQAGVSGIVRVLAAFSETGKISHVILLNTLGHGLDEQAIKAAKDIKFQPATKNGAPVTDVKVIEYSFAIY